MFANLRDEWKSTKSGTRHDLADTRLQLHWAMQLLGQAGAAWADPKPDFIHLSATWNRERGAFESHKLRGCLRAVLEPLDFAVAIDDESGDEVARLPLAGVTLAEAGEWLTNRARGLSPDTYEDWAPPTHDMPAHPVGDGRPFTALPVESASAFNAWYGNARAVCDAVRAAEPNVSPVRVWPHHFDMAILITESAAGEPERTIGLGMSPGDSTFEVPYWYLSVHPRPQSPAFGRSPGDGKWYTQNWVGAVLVGDASAKSVGRFVTEALRGLRELAAP